MKIIVFDIETTGLNREHDQIIQISASKIDTDLNENWNIIDEINLMVRPVEPYSISIGAYFKHNITPAKLKECLYFKDIAKIIVEFFEDTDNILTYNGNSFDIPFLKTELNKYGYDIDFTKKNLYDAFLEEKRRNGISLSNTYLRYFGKTMSEDGLEAHNALADIKATYSIFKEQQKIQNYGPEKCYGEDNVIVDMEFCGNICPCFNIGKYKGVSLEWVIAHDSNYINWILSDKCKFLSSTKEYVRKTLNNN